MLCTVFSKAQHALSFVLTLMRQLNQAPQGLEERWVPAPWLLCAPHRAPNFRSNFTTSWVFCWGRVRKHRYYRLWQSVLALTRITLSGVLFLLCSCVCWIAPPVGRRITGLPRPFWILISSYTSLYLWQQLLRFWQLLFKYNFLNQRYAHHAEVSSCCWQFPAISDQPSFSAFFAHFYLKNSHFWAESLAVMPWMGYTTWETWNHSSLMGFVCSCLLIRVKACCLR